jgi:hypothetical protein
MTNLIKKGILFAPAEYWDLTPKQKAKIVNG